jgi:hypothetical protein
MKLAANANRRFQLHEGSQFFIRAHNEMFSVAVSVSNPDRPARERRRLRASPSSTHRTARHDESAAKSEFDDAEGCANLALSQSWDRKSAIRNLAGLQRQWPCRLQGQGEQRDRVQPVDALGTASILSH